MRRDIATNAIYNISGFCVSLHFHHHRAPDYIPFKSSKIATFIILALPKLPFTSIASFKMPLILPGMNSGEDNSKTTEWSNKLVGKKLGDGPSNATVGNQLQCQNGIQYADWL
jgi:hypothetical protein